MNFGSRPDGVVALAMWLANRRRKPDYGQKCARRDAGSCSPAEAEYGKSDAG
jgi:hypothetical protein